tara:strand:+ start:754 stop:870 length:117 start_codon:yes stop_codon:yes gene_type:complete
MRIIMLLTIILFVSCSTSKNIDDTEHNWRGDNGIEFKE